MNEYERQRRERKIGIEDRLVPNASENYCEHNPMSERKRMYVCEMCVECTDERARVTKRTRKMKMDDRV